MLRPPVYVTPGAHEDPSANPWIDASNESSVVFEPNAELSDDISIKGSSSCHHSRSQIIAGDPLCSPYGSLNEYHTVLERRGVSLDLDETRPSLKRAISRNRRTFEGERPVDMTRGKETTQAEAEVIVHQIQPDDSLPGIALKYNVSLATLRSTNKLWTNDTIHLRQVLYIPIKAIGTGKARSIPHPARARLDHPSQSHHSAPEVHTRTFPRTLRSSSEWITNYHPETTVPHASAVHAIPATTSSIIKRVPLSELSFFPPSSTSSLSSPKHPSLHTQRQLPLLLSKYDDVGTLSSSFPNPSLRGASMSGLVSLWNGAKDEITTRLSFDSTRGSSDASEEHDLELDVVRPRRRVRHRRSSTDSDQDQELISYSAGTAIAMHSITEQNSILLNTPHKPKMVRSIQLQPSPKMVIPARGEIGRAPSTDKGGV